MEDDEEEEEEEEVEVLCVGVDVLVEMAVVRRAVVAAAEEEEEVVLLAEGVVVVAVVECVGVGATVLVEAVLLTLRIEDVLAGWLVDVGSVVVGRGLLVANGMLVLVVITALVVVVVVVVLLAAHFASMQLCEVQSVLTIQFSPIAQVGQIGPPQSTSVSCPS